MTDLRVAYDYGFKSVTQSLFGGDGPRYSLTFRMIELAHFPDSLTAPGQRSLVTVSMRWQLIVEDNRGRVLKAVSRTTESPKRMYQDSDADEAVASLVERSLGEVVGILEEFGKTH